MPTANYSVHSEYNPLESVLLCSVETAFGSAEKLSSQWKLLDFLEKPDFKLAHKEYLAFAALIAEYVPQILWMPANESLSLDALYCRDASIATDFGMILCSMGKENRKAEPEIQKKIVENSGVDILGEIKDPGTLEGGDVAWIDKNTLAVGHSYRTNESGISQLKELLTPFDIGIVEVDLPHYKGPRDVFHLMSVFSPVDEKLAVVYSPLMPVRFRNLLLKRGYELVEVPETEFESLGCNVLAVAPRVCVLASGNPITEARLKKAGCKVLTYSGIEISVKGGGGPTCLTRPLKRSLQV